MPEYVNQTTTQWKTGEEEMPEEKEPDFDERL
jgi:hypothetical protein